MDIKQSVIGFVIYSKIYVSSFKSKHASNIDDTLKIILNARNHSYLTLTTHG